MLICYDPRAVNPAVGTLLFRFDTATARCGWRVIASLKFNVELWSAFMSWNLTRSVVCRFCTALWFHLPEAIGTGVGLPRTGGSK